MASSPHLQNLIAHYLAVNYPAVLEPFLHAARIPAPDPAHPPQPDLRTLVADWTAQQLAEDVSNLGMNTVAASQAAPLTPRDLLKVSMPPHVELDGVVRSLEGLSAANLLTVQAARVPKREFDTSSASYRASYHLSVLTSSVDKTLKIIDYATGEVDRILEPHRAAVLCFDLHPQSRYLVTGSMDGTTVLTDLITMQPLQTFKSTKFVVRTKFSPDGRWLATASYDHHIVIYEAISGLDPPTAREGLGADDEDDDAMLLDETDDPALAADPTLRFVERRRITVDSNPESLLFHPASTWLLYTLRSSHELHYQQLGEPWATRTKSFNPHPLDTHMSFAVLDMALHPAGTLVACQTGDHRGGSGERILLYGVEPDETERLGCLWTGSEGDDFVLPRMAWLPDGTGLITTTPNGYLKLITLAGEVRSSVKVHGAIDLGQASSEVVRDCAVVETEQGWEVVSVGYDRRVRFTR